MKNLKLLTLVLVLFGFANTPEMLAQYDDVYLYKIHYDRPVLSSSPTEIRVDA